MRGNYQVRFCGGRGAAMLFSPTQQHPEERQVMVCQWIDGRYEDTVVKGNTPIPSTVVPTLELTVEKLFALEQ